MITNVTTTPVEDQEVVSLATAKLHLKLEADDQSEDTLIQAYIDAAVEAAENYLNGALTEKDVVIELSKFEGPFVFEAFPLIEVTSVKYRDSNDDEVTMVSGTDYRLTQENSKVWKLRFPTGVTLPSTYDRDDAVTIAFKTGYEADSYPKSIISAILLMIGDLYEVRNDRGEVGYNSAAHALMRPYRKG